MDDIKSNISGEIIVNEASPQTSNRTLLDTMCIRVATWGGLRPFA